MACFPRFFRANSKNSFTPAIDENSDTVLNVYDNNTVQAGRYVRRDELPISELPVESGQQNTSVPKQNARFDKNTGNGSIDHTTSNINNTNNTSSTNNTSTYSKKFISNKPNIGNKNNNNNNSINTSFNHNTQTNANFKLKPVKERRPTALPTDQPLPTISDKIDNDEDEEEEDYVFITNRLDDELDGYLDVGSYPHTPNTPSIQNVKFFIGGRAGDEGSVSGSASYANANQATMNSFGQPTNKQQSNSSGVNKPGQPTEAAQQRVQDEVKIVRVPTPPPLPPQLLTSAASTTSMASIRSANAKRHTNAIKELNGSISMSDFSMQLEAHLEWGFENLKTCETFSGRASDNNNCDSIKTSKSTGNSQDSGVEDTSSTPKDSDVSDLPASHRVEGGLIYTRVNLPISKKDIEIPYIRKDEATRDLLRAAIKKNEFLHNYMDKERTEKVIDAMASAYYDKDDFIIRENDEGSEIYVSEDGYFDVIKNEKVVGTFGPATVFGELAILYNAKRFASVQACTYARVWKIDRDTFRHIMMISGSKERQENLNFLKSAPFLKDLTDEVLDKVADLLQRKFYETNTCIVREGEVGNEFFIIRGGTVTIKKKNSEGNERVVARRKRGEYFGEQALVNADCRQASVYADAPGTEVLKLDREAFNSYLGTIPQLREKPESSDVEAGRDSNRKSEFDTEYADIELTDLKKIATLGAGAFGRVDLVSYNEKIFALKIIKKIDIVKQDQIEHVYSEKHVMMKCRTSPFIIELYKTYRNEKFVYFLMEACMGGDVWTVMSQRRFFDEKTARFLAGCVVEAFDFLHSHNIIYRDLKPENLMLTTDGYCKLVDFGFAKHIPPHQKTNTFAGTPEYVAPEIILDRGHDRAVDYWALGILIYELLVGKTPFREQNQIKIYQKILGGIDVIQMPSKIPKSAQNLIKNLCKQLPAERLGYQRKGIQDIKKHSWFDNLDWQKLKTKQLASPIKRPLSSNTDTQYFGPPGVDDDHDPPDETSGWDIDF